MGAVELSAVDYALFIGSLVCVAAVGVYFAFYQRQQTTRQILLGNRQLGVFPITMTLLASFISAISVLGFPADIYANGTMFCYFLVTYCVAFPIAAFVYLPVFYDLKLTSAYEYLELRFNRAVRLVASATFIFQSLFYMAVVLYAPALAISSVMPIPVYASILITGTIATFYTSVGGAKAVVWTSTIQILFILAGLLAVIIAGAIQLDGFGRIGAAAQSGGRVWFDDFRPDPRVRHSFWSLTVGGTFTLLTMYAANQMAIQRYMSMPRLRDAKTALLLNVPSCFLSLTLYTLCGLIMYASYAGCDPIAGGAIKRSDQLLIFFVADRLHALIGLPGLFLAGLYGAGLSTLAGGCNALTAVVLVDFVKPNRRLWHRLRPHEAWFSKALTAGIGLLCIGLAFIFTLVQSTVLQIAFSIFGVLGGPILGVFTLGMFVPWANWKGAIAAQIASLVVTAWIAFGAISAEVAVVSLPVSYRNDTCMTPNVMRESLTGFNVAKIEVPLKDFYRLSYQYYSLVALLVSLLVGVLVSFATGKMNPRMLERRLFVPKISAFYCCLPKRLRPVFAPSESSIRRRPTTDVLIRAVETKETLLTSDTE